MSSILPKNELGNSNFCPSLLGQTFFVHFLGELKTPKSPFEINWPLAIATEHLPWPEPRGISEWWFEYKCLMTSSESATDPWEHHKSHHLHGKDLIGNDQFESLGFFLKAKYLNSFILWFHFGSHTDIEKGFHWAKRKMISSVKKTNLGTIRFFLLFAFNIINYVSETKPI